MRIDRYVRVMLAIIAACLVWLSLGGAQRWPTLRAQAPPSKPFPTVFQNGDLGYRINTRRPGEAPMGTLLVKIDGLWWEARLDYRK